MNLFNPSKSSMIKLPNATIILIPKHNNHTKLSIFPSKLFCFQLTFSTPLNVSNIKLIKCWQYTTYFEFDFVCVSNSPYTIIVKKTNIRIYLGCVVEVNWWQ